MTAQGFTSGDPRKLTRDGYSKGAVVAADTAGTLTAVPPGVAGEVLTVDPPEPTGVDWEPGGGGGGTPSNTVVAETAFGQATAAGAAVAYSRGDHTHGSPPLTSSAPLTVHGIGQTAAVGAATTPARADHVHPLAAAAVPGGSAVGDTAATGAVTTFAASDHRHGRETFGTVTAQTVFGLPAADGAATSVARSDHTHGTPAAPRATETWSKDGTAAVVVGGLRWYNRTGATRTIHGVWAAAGTAPTGTALIVDVNRSGTTIFTTQANRPTIAVGTNGGTLATPDVTTLADGDYLTVDIDAVGSGVAGADVTVGVVMS